MASEREPGWYWVRLRDYAWRPAEMCEGEQRVILFGGRVFEQSDVTEWGPRIHPPDAEHPDASLRERLGAELDAMEREHGEMVTADTAGWARRLSTDVAMLRRCTARIRALLRTEGQPPHPDPSCPHNLWKCTCDGDSDG